MRTLGFIAGALVTALVVWARGMHPAVPDEPGIEMRQIEQGIDGASVVARLPEATNPETPPAGPAEAPDPPEPDEPPEEGFTQELSADAALVAPTSPVADSESDTPVLPDEMPAGRGQADVPRSVDADASVEGLSHPIERPPQAGEDDGRWLAFFTPFRSEASARGFAQHLESATGRRFHVMRAGPGDYRVEFRMVADEDEGQRIEEIEDASGLALRAGRL